MIAGRRAADTAAGRGVCRGGGAGIVQGCAQLIQRQRRESACACACSCMRRDPDASRRRSLRAPPRAPGLRTVRLGGGGVSGSGRDEGACKITTAPRHEAGGRVRLGSGAAGRTAVRRVIAFDRSIDRCVVTRRLLSTCHQLTGNRQGKRDSGGTSTATATHVRLARAPHASPEACAGTRGIRPVASASAAAARSPWQRDVEARPTVRLPIGVPGWKPPDMRA